MIMRNLIEQINSSTATVGVVGLGYVGLPLSLAFAKKYKVIGFDLNSEVITNLQARRSHIHDVSDYNLSIYLNKSFHPTSEFERLEICNFIIICVPTPLTLEREPDLSYIKSACRSISKVLKRGQFVILESTTYPGTTEEVVVPLLEESGLKVLDDFGVAYSPERVDPGNKEYTIETTPKIVGGLNDECTEIAALLYGSVINSIIKVKDTKTAESVKMLENIFRNINIAVVNELSLIFEKMDIDSWEVINAASTKPYGFMAFYPGPGVGGHCIPLDPFYMSYKAKKHGFIPRFIETSGEINDFMRTHVVNLAELGLKFVGKKIYGAKIAVMGLSYKRNIDDTREAPSIKIIEELLNLGANVNVYDPHVGIVDTNYGTLVSNNNISETLNNVDCAIFVVDHDLFKNINIYNYVGLMRSPVIIDCKNIFHNLNNDIIYIGLGKSPAIRKRLL